MAPPDPEQGVSAAPHRKIIHIDMDAFYASVEQRDNAGLRRQIRDIFAEHTSIIEPLSLDEAYLDVTENLQGIPLARDVALRIREKIKAETGLNASAGISYNKFLAKLASDHRKPNGQYVISPEMGAGFVETLPVGKFHGIGPATSARFNALGIFSGLDIRNQTLAFLQQHFGKAGAYYYWISRGVDERPVRANRIRKSVGAENTFSSDLTEFDGMVAELQPLVDKIWRHCEATDSRGRAPIGRPVAGRDAAAQGGAAAGGLAVVSADRRPDRAATGPADLTTSPRPPSQPSD
jgi:nucleotidyltransferase/DNA polymerase involved in DNA repair